MEYNMNMKFKHVENKAELDSLTTKYKDGMRLYESPTGKFLPSVTTVVGWDKQKFFAEWRRKNPKESKRVLARGNKLHTLIEDYLNNKFDVESAEDKSKVSPDILDLFLMMQPNLNNIDNVYAQEVPLWSEQVGLAGRVDCVAEYNGQLSIIDFKGSTREKREEDIDNYFEQATAYAIMWHERTGVRIDNIVIIIASEDGTTQVFEKKPINYVKSLYNKILKFRREHQNELEYDRKLSESKVV